MLVEAHVQWRQDAELFLASELFARVQCQPLFPDSKTFADAVPNKPWADISQAFEWWKTHGNGDLLAFVQQHFILPQHAELKAEHGSQSLASYIAESWARLTRPADSAGAGSLIPLPHPYLVPGGRFREIYYWDSYFSALGLVHAGKHQLVRDMLENFIAIQAQMGCIPNGNRLYYRSRSQPPVLALLVEMVLAQDASPDLLVRCYGALQAEYAFWMRGGDQLSPGQQRYRVVKMPCGAVLNRYYDESMSPRPESYREDIELAEHLAPSARGQFYQDLRAACESGWDFSSRWLADPYRLDSIQTTAVVPVDLNAFMFNLERQLATLAEALHYPDQQRLFQQASEQRRQAIYQYLWHPDSQFFMDWHVPSQGHTKARSLAAVVPLFVGLATRVQACAVADALKSEFLRSGGLVTTGEQTGQQWDAPNGWAPLQWMAVAGLKHYGFDDLACDIARRWCDNVEHYFQQQGVVLEKYDVCQPANKAGGGEYEVQLGFGWTNGVVVAMQALLAQSTE